MTSSLFSMTLSIKCSLKMKKHITKIRGGKLFFNKFFELLPFIETKWCFFNYTFYSSQQHSKIVPWMRKTEYISSEFQRFGVAADRQETKVRFTRWLIFISFAAIAFFLNFYRRF